MSRMWRTQPIQFKKLSEPHMWRPSRHGNTGPKIQINETAKQVAMDVASSTGKITQEQIQNKAEELVQERVT